MTKQLPKSVQEAVSPDGTLGLRVPAGGVLLDVLRMLAGPVVLTSANRSGEPKSVTAEEVVRALGDDVALGAERRPLPLRPAVVGCAGAEESSGSAPRGRRGRGNAAAAGQCHGIVCMHRQHVSQPHGRGADARASGELN